MPSSTKYVKLNMAGLLWNTDVMADVLAFLPRKMIALQLASASVAFSALCSCCCLPEMEQVEAIEENCADAEVAPVVLQRRKLFQWPKSKK